MEGWNINDTTECLEMAKEYIFRQRNDVMSFAKGLELLQRAYNMRNPEAVYLMAVLMIQGAIRLRDGSDESIYALELLYGMANIGYKPARSYLDRYCKLKYEESIGKKYERCGKAYPLSDFNGRLIKIDRTGIFTPVDAKLEFADERNILTLRVNVSFYHHEDIDNVKMFEQAVMDGISLWGGEYEVFGGQRLTVRIALAQEKRIYGNVTIVPVTKGCMELSGKFGKSLCIGRDMARLKSIINDKRSAASLGTKWSVNSRKIIFIHVENDAFDYYEEIMHLAKHEFGHVLGLGDIYRNNSDRLEGVQNGAYEELDSFYIGRGLYNLVMCDHHGMISNNDMEMVVLAFSENRFQSYQPGQFKGKLSKALGRGN